MKPMTVVLLTTVLLVAGCIHDSPLTEEHKIPIDPAVIGLWEEIPDEGKEPDPENRIMVLKYSDTEYLVHYPLGKNGIYNRAYPVKPAGISCVQLQVIGLGKGPVPEEEKKLYYVASYTLSNGELEIKTLNTDLVGKDLKGSAAIKKAFLENKDNKDLFRNPNRYRRITAATQASVQAELPAKGLLKN